MCCHMLLCYSNPWMGHDPIYSMHVSSEGRVPTLTLSNRADGGGEVESCVSVSRHWMQYLAHFLT